LSGLTAQILAPTTRLAHQLSQKLNNHVIKSKFLVCGCKFELDFLTRKGKSAGARLVLRNLHFNTSAFDLYAAFAPFGAIHSIETPVNKEGKGRGFAFVWFIQKKAAEEAIRKMNGKTLYPGLGEERVKEGGEGKKQTRQRLKAEGEELKKDARVVAVDWALAKDQFEKAQQEATQPKPQQEASSQLDGTSLKSEVSEEESSGDEEQEGSDEDMSPVEENEDEDSEAEFSPVENDQAESEEEEEEPARPQGTTLFVRNVQFEATEDELFALCVLSHLVILISCETASLQIQSIWSRPICSYCCGSHHREIQRHWLCLFLPR
jgi:nucleolar protein 4